MLLKSNKPEESSTNGERVDPRITRSRQMIEQAFIDLLAKDGLEALTVRDITAHAGVNRATFYAHFEDKYALFTHVLEKSLDHLLQTRLPKQATFSADNLKLLILALIEFFNLGNDSSCTLERDKNTRTLVESRVQEQIATLLQSWLRATPHRHQRATVEMTATLASWTIFGLSLSYVKSNNLHPDLAEISQAVGVIMHGVIGETERITEGSNATTSRNRIMPNKSLSIHHLQQESFHGTAAT